MDSFIGRAAVASIGCKVNKYDALVAERALEEAGFQIVGFPAQAEVYVINTCAVTGEAAKKSRAAIRRAVSLNFRAVVVVAGCWGKLEAEKAREIDGVDIVVGAGEYERLGDIVLEEWVRRTEVASGAEVAGGSEVAGASGAGASGAGASGAEAKVARGAGARVAEASGAEVAGASGAEAKVARGAEVAEAIGAEAKVARGAEVAGASGAEVAGASGAEVARGVEVAGASGAEVARGVEVARGAEVAEASGAVAKDAEVAEASGAEARQNRNKMTRAYLKIQDGCDNRCSYCVIPLARGPVRSRSLEDIRAEAYSLAQAGVKEIVLTGIQAAYYGRDLHNGAGLGEVCRVVAEIPQIKRIRLSSISPKAVDGEFVGSLKEAGKVCGYFHLSLQSGSDAVLRRMNRGYTTEDYLSALSELRKAFPDCSVWSDVIVGFPGESEGEFCESMEFIESCGINKLHIFPFSPKKGTAACRMEGHIPQAVKTGRCGELKELNTRIYERFVDERLGRAYPVLIEALSENGYYTGHTDNNIFIGVKADRGCVNTIVEARLTARGRHNKAEAFDAFAEICGDALTEKA